MLSKKTKEVETINEPLYEILKRRELSKAEFIRIKNQADRLGILFFATVSFDEDIDFLHDIGCSSVKIASADCNHYPLLRKAAQTGMNIQIDTAAI